MSDDRETPASRAAEAPETSTNPGAPVEETEASRTEVLAAVERAKGAGVDGEESAVREIVVEKKEEVVVSDSSDAASDTAADELAHRREVSEVDTQLDLEAPAKSKTSRIAETEVMPSAAADPVLEPKPSIDDTPVRDGEIRISEVHPMAALYTQSPTPPDIRGNRAAGSLIALLAAIGFALVYAGALALWISPSYPPSTFLSEGLLPLITSIGFAAAVAGFLIALILLVVIVGRAGWWAYVLGGFLVAAAVWASAVLGSALHDHFVLGERVGWDPVALVREYGLTIPVVLATLVAREATVWFGAWIGARGRRVKLRNAEALADYEQALAEVQAKQP